MIAASYPPDIAATVIDRTDPDGHLLGVAAVHLREPSVAYLSCHFVARRRCGIGSALTAARLDWARTHGARIALATTHPWNTASLTNLISHGFVVGESTPDTWVGDGDIVELTAKL